MKNVCFINGSPKGKSSNSLFYLKQLDKLMNEKEYAKEYIHIKLSEKNGLENDFKKMENSNLIIISFPLYVYCLPGLLIKFLEDYYTYLRKKEKYNKDVRVYAIVNCGFPDPKINAEALMVVSNFCDHLNLNWRFGIGIGMGEFIGTIKNVPILNKFCNKVFNSTMEIINDIENKSLNKINNFFVKPNIPKFIFFLSANIKWIISAKMNGLKIMDLFKRPYKN